MGHGARCWQRLHGHRDERQQPQRGVVSRPVDTRVPTRRSRRARPGAGHGRAPRAGWATMARRTCTSSCTAADRRATRCHFRPPAADWHSWASTRPRRRPLAPHPWSTRASRPRSAHPRRGGSQRSGACTKARGGSSAPAAARSSRGSPTPGGIGSRRDRLRHRLVPERARRAVGRCADSDVSGRTAARCRSRRGAVRAAPPGAGSPTRAGRRPSSEADERGRQRHELMPERAGESVDQCPRGWLPAEGTSVQLAEGPRSARMVSAGSKSPPGWVADAFLG